MRPFDEYGYGLCRFLGRVFEMSLETEKCSSPIFLRRFMHSDACHMMDRDAFLYTSDEETDIINMIEAEYGKTAYGKIRYTKDEIYWMGYMYRYWCYVYEISSVRAYNLLKPAKLRSFYEVYHTLDPGNAIERIMESEGIVLFDYMNRGVEILRRKIEEEKQPVIPVQKSV